MGVNRDTEVRMSITIGIDWSEEYHDVCILHETGTQLARFQIDHSPTGFTHLAEKIDRCGLQPMACLVALETAHNLLVDFLWSRQYSVYVIAPSIVNSSRGRFGSSGARTDQSDAQLLADLLRTDRARFTPWRPDSPLVCQMKAKLSLIDRLTKAITAHSNQLRAVLLRYYPQALTIFGHLTSQISLQFLMTFPTPAALTGLSYAAFAQFCQEHTYRRADYIAKAYAALQRPVPEADPIMVRAYQDETPLLAHLLLIMVRNKQLAIREVQTLFEQHPDQAIFASLPGAGNLLAPKLLVIFGDDRARFPCPQAIQSLAGTCPVTKQSGKKKTVRFRQACNRDYRQATQQLAIASVKQSVWAAGYFSDARSRGLPKNQIYRSLANRWLAIAWHLWQSRQLYDEAYHLSQVRRHRRKQV